MMVLWAVCLILALNLVASLQPIPTSCLASNSSADPIFSPPSSPLSSIALTTPLTKLLDDAAAVRQQSRLNVTQLLFSRFNYLFQDTYYQSVSTAPQDPLAQDSEFDQQGQHQDSVEGTYQPAGPSTGEKSEGEQSLLETRKIEHNRNLAGNSLSPNDEQERRNYFKILNKVFSRVDLPEVYRTSRFRGSHCALHIGCVEEIPNFPNLLKKPNVSSSFTIYNRENPKLGHRIPYEPIVHYQLEDSNTSEPALYEKLKAHQQQQLQLQLPALPQPNSARPRQVAPFVVGSLTGVPLHHHHHQLGRLQQQQQLLQQQPQQQQQQQAAISWRSATKIAHSQEYPFDLSSLEQSGFNASLNTRIIVGGYFAKEDEEWIDEVVRQWLLLEPSNIIKVSWADANRGLYHTAAYNSRIVARQLTLFLYYLDQLFHINLSRFHLVGHSLGAHIAGFVGADNEGKLARITGLDPAGPIFVELNNSMRLDPSDAKFVDVLHTNGGPITKGALGLSTPSGHVDYYCNGGSIQPGCYFSSVTKSIMDPVERVACNHRRSYRYFIEIIKLAISERAAEIQQEPALGRDHSSLQPNHRSSNSSCLASLLSSLAPATAANEIQAASSKGSSQLPRAFLFEAKQDELVRLVQPEIVLLSQSMRREASSDSAPPLKRHLEFHLLNPDFPVGKRGLYFFRTRSESPFFATQQYALTLKTDVVIRRKMALMARIDQTLVAEVELDEIHGSYTLAFAPNDPRLLEIGDDGRVPQLSLMWRFRSFNLLLNQQNELYLSGLELSLLDSDDSGSRPVIRYSQTTGTIIATPTTATNGSPSGVLKSGFNATTSLALTRNQWHKFEGKLLRGA